MRPHRSSAKIMDGNYTPAQAAGVAAALAIEGRERRRDRRCGARDARAQPARRTRAADGRRRRRDRWRSRQHAQYLDDGGARRCGDRNSGRQARQSRGVERLRQCRRARGGRLSDRDRSRGRGRGCCENPASRLCSRRATIRRCAMRRPLRRELGVRTIFNLARPADESGDARRTWSSAWRERHSSNGSARRCARSA